MKDAVAMMATVFFFSLLIIALCVAKTLDMNLAPAMPYKARLEYQSRILEQNIKKAVWRTSYLEENHPKLTLFLAELAELYILENRLSEAEDLYKRGIEIVKKSQNNPLELSYFFNKLSVVYVEQFQTDKALSLLLSSLQLNEPFPASEQHIETLGRLGDIYSYQGKYGEGEKHYLRALLILDDTFWRNRAVYEKAISNNLGRMYVTQRRWLEAEKRFLRCLEIAKIMYGPDHPETGRILFNLADLHHKKGAFIEAKSKYLFSIKILEKSLDPKHPDIGQALNGLAVLYKDLGLYAEAENLHLRVLNIRQNAYGSTHPSIAKTLNNLAVLYSAQERYREATVLYEKSWTLTKKLYEQNPQFEGTISNNLAMVYHYQNQPSKAEPLYLNALEVNKKLYGAESAEFIKSLLNLAEFYTDQDRLEEAETLYLRSFSALKKVLGPEHPDRATALDGLANLYKKQSRYVDSESLTLQVLSIDERVYGPKHPTISDSLGKLSHLRAAQFQYPEAYDYSRRAYELLRLRFSASGYLEDKGGRAELTSKLGDFLHHVSLSLRPEVPGDRSALDGEAFEALQLTRSSSAGRAAQQMALRFASNDDAVARIVRRQQDLQTQLAKQDEFLINAISEKEQDAERVKQIRARQFELSEELKSVNDQIAQKFPRYAELMRREPLSVSEVQELLGKEEVLITLTPSYDNKQTHVFLLSQSGLKVQTVDLSAEEMTALVNKLRVGLDLTKGIPAFPLDASYQLYRRLFGGLENDLKLYKHILYVPSAAMESIPLNVLTVTESDSYNNATWLAKTHSITRLPTIGSLKAARLFAGPSAGTEPLKGFGDPILKGGNDSLRGLKIVKLYKGQSADPEQVRALPSLPETAVELRQIAQLLGANDNDLYLREAATETKVKTTNLANSRVLAFATHGLVAGELEQLAEPALVLTPPKEGTEQDDGLLKASEIAQLKLDADWVILSACNTAAGDQPGAEGLSGLARAFIYAGARSMLVSHWPVETNSAHKLTTGLFKALNANDNLTKADALRQSMLQLASTKGFEHPALWAPFSLVGASSR